MPQPPAVGDAVQVVPELAGVCSPTCFAIAVVWCAGGQMVGHGAHAAQDCHCPHSGVDAVPSASI